MAIVGNAPALDNRLVFNSTIQGVDLLSTLVSAGATVVDGKGVRRPQLAESVPSTNDGSWKVLPDGRMETSWRIREGAIWHDGAPITADDFVFTVQVGREVPDFSDPVYAQVGNLEALDSRTVLVRWKSPYINAGGLFTQKSAPLPKRLLEQAYQDGRDRLLDLPFWTTEFVGSGAFKSREFVRDSHAALEAFDGYVDGRPKLDQLEVRFIPDGNAMVSNFIAGSVELFIGRGFSMEQAIQVRDRWPGGRLEFVLSTVENLWAQLLTPDPPIISNVKFRQSLLYAIDRDEMAASLLAGTGAAFEGLFKPNDVEFGEVQSAVVRYPYDPRRTAEGLGTLGYGRRTDGLFRSQSGETVPIEIRTLASDLNQKLTLSVVNYWRQAGVDASILTIPPQRQNDSVWRANFPGFQILSGGAGIAPISLHSSKAPLPANSYRVSGNYPRYMNPDYDALADRYYATIPWSERMEVLREIVRWITDQVPVAGLIVYSQPTLVSNRLRNVTPGTTWNLQEWDVP